MATIKQGCISQDYVPGRMLKQLAEEFKQDCAYCGDDNPLIVNSSFEMPVEGMVIGKQYRVLVIEQYHSAREYRVSRCSLTRIS